MKGTWGMLNERSALLQRIHQMHEKLKETGLTSSKIAMEGCTQSIILNGFAWNEKKLEVELPA
jgi:hypothetical protein